MAAAPPERGFEFRRDLEQLVHDGVLHSRRQAQRAIFRPGVLASSEPADVRLQERAKKKLARALRSSPYGATECKDTDESGELLAEVNVPVREKEVERVARSKEQENVEQVKIRLDQEQQMDQEKNQEKNKVSAKQTEALSWTQHGVESPQGAQDKKKNKSGDKQKTRELNEQVQDARRQLLARGWRDPMQQKSKKDPKKERSVEKEKENKAASVPEKKDVSASSNHAMEDADDELLRLRIHSTTKIKADEDDGGMFGLLEEAETTVVSAEEIKKSAAVDTAALIAAHAAADLAASKGKKGKGGKNKKGRNLLKHCRKNGLQKPKYKKLARPPGGGHLYSVVLSSKTRGKQEVTVRDSSDEPKVVKKEVEDTENALEDWSVDDWDADLSDEDTTVKDPSTSDITTSVDELEIEEESESDRKAALQLSQQLREQLQKRMRSSAYRSKLQQRESLPIASFKKQVVEMLSNHDVILISGETGCGKSTQVPQFLLEDLLLSEPGGARGQIVCTQPRRLAAISLAERVSEELGEASMGTGDSLTGFQIRLETRMTRRTRLLFCTTGILLRKLQDPRTLGEEVSHVIVDEVHERDLQSDVLLAMLRQFLAEGNAARRRKFGGTLPPLKVILMSATLNAASFQRYFGGAAVCPMIEVPGRTFPVEQFYLEDVLEKTQFVVDEESPAYVPVDESGSDRNSTQVTISGRGGTSYTQQVSWTSSSSSSKTTASEAQQMLVENYSDSTLLALERIDPSVVNYELIQALLEYITTETDLLSLSKSEKKSASVLVFLPGLQEITTLLDILGGSRLLRHDPHGREFELLPLHSSLSAQEQQRIFRQRLGVIRVIAATNIAETSLTIDDVKVVIDTGRVKQMSHDAQRRTNVLDEIWVARANAKQRAGRAGRTSGGSCFRLFPQSVFRSVMLEQPVPEIRRAPLTSLCLQIKTFGVGGEQKDGCGEFLRACLDPPDEVSIQDALEELFEIGALDREDEALTKLGAHLARLPVDVKVGKLLLLGALFGVFDAASTCAAVLETKSPFVAPFGRQSDMKQARQTFTLGFLPLSESAGDERMTRQQLATISAILYAGLAPNLVHAEPPMAYGPKRAVLRERDHGIVVMHPGSINYKVASFRASNFLTYAVKLHTSQVYLPASSLVLPLAVCLFSHTLEPLPQLRRKDNEGNETIGLRVNDWVVFHSSFRSAALLLEMRIAILEVINASLETPPYARGGKSESNARKSEREELVDALRVLFLAEYEERDPNKQLSGQLCAGKKRD
ncbi:P-loop containing nucleoside triphosphate hydrolase [Phytophthora cactorum]|nr:P-loop containing nucleoside triphosphate hydrolase [Phytophthora cactorum]